MMITLRGENGEIFNINLKNPAMNGSMTCFYVGQFFYIQKLDSDNIT